MSIFFLNNIPHNGGLTLSHNAQRAVYQTAEEWLENNDDHFEWDSDEAKKRARQTASIWSLIWYPNTPVGFYSIAAPTLEELIALAEKFMRS